MNNKIKWLVASIILSLVLILTECGQNSIQRETTSNIEDSNEVLIKDQDKSTVNNTDALDNLSVGIVYDTDCNTEEKSETINQGYFIVSDEPVDLRFMNITCGPAEFTMGTVLEDTRLYPCPSEEIYEVGVIYKGREFQVLKKVYTCIASLTIGEKDSESEWYLVSAGTYMNHLGFVRAEYVKNSESTDIEPSGPWQIISGKPYYFNSSCFEEKTADYSVGPINEIKYLEEDQVWEAEGLAGAVYYINSLDVLEPYTGLGLSRKSHAN